MPNLRPPDNFEPSANAKWWWLFSPKAHYRVTQYIRFPGFYKTDHFWAVCLFFCIAIGLEIAGINLIIEKLVEKWIQLIWLLILFDILIAFLSHITVGRRNYTLNQEICTDNQIQRNNYHTQSRNLVIYRVILCIFIVAVAAFKIYLLYRVEKEISLWILPWIGVYMVIAIIHIFVTGFFIFEVIGMIIWSNQRKVVLHQANSDYEVLYCRTHDFTSPTPLDTTRQGQLCSSQVGLININGEPQLRHHVLESLPNGNSNKYRLITWGVLTDVQVIELINFQTNDAQKLMLAIECLRCQLGMFDQNATRPALAAAPGPVPVIGH